MNSHIFIQLAKSILLIFLMVCNNLGNVIKGYTDPFSGKVSYVITLYKQVRFHPGNTLLLLTFFSDYKSNICSLWKAWRIQEIKLIIHPKTHHLR